MSLSGADPNSLGSGFAALPEPPYWAVIFTAQRSGDDAGYSAMAEAMLALATQQPGYIGVESSRDIKGFGITVSYWADTVSILAWKADLRTSPRKSADTRPGTPTTACAWRRSSGLTPVHRAARARRWISW